MPRVFGYLKLGANKKNAQFQLDRLKAAGVSKIYQEKHSDQQRNTPLLDMLMAEVQEGDTLVVTSLAGIAVNTKHLLEIVGLLQKAGVILKVIDRELDTSTSDGRMLPKLLEAIVDFERQIVRERQASGIAKAKREGRYKGRKPTARAKTDEVLALDKSGLTRQKIADELGIGVASVYRILKASAETKKPRRKAVMEPEESLIVKQKQKKPRPTREDDAEQLSLF